MKYDLTKHAIIEDNGDLVATFNSCISAGQAFKILDDLNNAKDVLDLEIELDGAKDDLDFLKQELKDLERNFVKKETEVEKLDDRLQSIITMLESDHDFKTMEEMAEEIIAICAEKL
jgi:predicted nuclease with TOPRIM domain